jgi:hypothetical protein
MNDNGGEPHGAEALDATLAYDLAAARLRRATFWAGGVLLLAPVLPFEVVGTTPVFIWDVLGELGPAAQVAALSPSLAGGVILALAKFVRRPSTLAACVLMIMGVLTLLSMLGADAAAWDVTSLPDSLTHRQQTAMLAIALSAAAIRLRADNATHRAAGVLGILAVVAALLFALWPSRGEIPIATLVRFAFTNRELSAHVAELTAKGASPKLGLVHILPFAYFRPSTVLYHVAILELEALAHRKLHNHQGILAPADLATAFNELAALSDNALRRRTEDAYVELFGERLVKVEIVRDWRDDSRAPRP